MGTAAALALIPQPLLTTSLRHTKVPKATLLFAEDSPSASFYVLEVGMVKVIRRFGADHVYSIVCPGATIGERAAFAQGPRGFTAETLSECTLVEIRSSDFVKAASEWPDLWMWIARHLVQRTADLERRIHRMVNLRVEKRILFMLADLSECAGAHFTAVRLPLTQLDVAMLVGATRETTSTTLNQLERKGLLRLGRAMVEVPSADELRKAAELL